MSSRRTTSRSTSKRRSTLLPERADLLVLPDIRTRGGANEFLYGIIFGQGERGSRSWSAATKLRGRLGTLEPSTLADMDLGPVIDAFCTTPAIHRMGRTMAKYLCRAASELAHTYEGDARVVWGCKNASAIRNKLVRFAGIGEHKATVALFLLSEVYRVLPVADAVEHVRANCPALYNASREGRLVVGRLPV